jgi:hypothetical protein
MLLRQRSWAASRGEASTYACDVGGASPMRSASGYSTG